MRTVSCTLIGLLCVLAQDPGDAAMLRQAQQLAVPVDAHQRLQRLVGPWSIEITATLPGVAATSSRGSVVASTMLGGRYVLLSYRLPLAGRDVEAVQILGFDTLHQIYTSSWRDDGSTWSVEATGSPQAGNPDLLRLQGALTDARDPAGRAFRIEMDLRQADAVEVRLFDTIDSKEVNVQTQRWSRPK